MVVQYVSIKHENQHNVASCSSCGSGSSGGRSGSGSGSGGSLVNLFHKMKDE